MKAVKYKPVILIVSLIALLVVVGSLILNNMTFGYISSLDENIADNYEAYIDYMDEDNYEEDSYENKYEDYLNEVTTTTPVTTTRTTTRARTTTRTTTRATTTVPVTTPATTLQAPVLNSNFEREVLDLVNAIREEKGIRTLSWHNGLATAARAHSCDMFHRDFFSHHCPDGNSPRQRLAAVGVTGLWGENLSLWQRNPQQVVTSLMNSPEHRANMLDPRWTRMGVGFCSYRWTQKFLR